MKTMKVEKIITYKFKREFWYEWIWFRVSRSYTEVAGPLPKLYMKVYKEVAWDRYIYCIFLVAPFVKLYFISRNGWFDLARFCYRRGYLKVEERARISWFWLKDLRRKKYDKI